MGILLGLLTVILIFVSLFLVLVVLAQKSKDGGMGTALGGGAAEAAFGAETNNVLSKATIYSSVIFFVLAFALYLARIHQHTHGGDNGGAALPTINAPAAPAPAATTPTASTAAPAVSVPATATTPSAATTSTASTPAPAVPAAKKP